MGIVSCLIAQDSTKTEKFVPSGKMMGKVFANFHYDLTQDANHSAYELSRAYCGYKHNFTKKVSGAILMDVGNDDVSVYSAYLKNAYLKWNATEKLTMSFGLAGTK